MGALCDVENKGRNIILASIQLSGSGYSVSVHDNEPSIEPEISAGHNGIRIWQLDDNPDLRLVAHSWLNLEHVITEDQKFSGNRDDPGFFEPRQYPINLQRTEKGVRLSHDPLPHTGCACWIEYAPGNRPGSLDFQLGFTPTRKVGTGQVMGLFLPCYIYQPDSKSIHFIGRRTKDSKKRWVEYCSSCHHSIVNFASESTDHPPAYENTDFIKGQDTARFSYPFICGRIGTYTFILMLDGGEELDIRFWMSPEGGGFDPNTNKTNPAWDFVVLKFGYSIDQEYSARGRLVISPNISSQRVTEEYEAWSGECCNWDD